MDLDHQAQVPPDNEAGFGSVTNISRHPRGYITKPAPADQAIRVYVHGVFDLFHIGHTRFLKHVKKSFPHTHLIVGVTEDHDTMAAKGHTVMTGLERAEIVGECRWVDEVIADCPPVLQQDFIDSHKIDYFAHDDDYEIPAGGDPYDFVKASGKFLVVPRVQDISTTEIISRIIFNLDIYLNRQKRNGFAAQHTAERGSG